MSANVKRKHPVRASKLQLQTLQAAFVPDQNLSAEEVKRLSDDTGLTCEWIRSWFGRFRKRERDARGTKREAISEPENDPPAQKKKRGRVARVPKLEESTLELPPGPISDNLPPADDSYIPPRSKTSTRPPFRLSLNLPPPSAQLPPRITLAPLVSYAAPGSHAYYYGSGVLALTFRVSNCAHRPTSNSLPLRTPSSLPIPLSVRCSSPAALWQSPQNVDPALQRIPEQAPANVTSRTPASSNPTAYNRTAPSLFLPLEAPLHFTSILPRLPFPILPSNKNTPVPGLQPPFDPSYSNDSFKHTHSLITPSHLHSYIPNLEDNNENDDPQSAGAAISNDDHLLFSSRTAAASVPAGDDNVFERGESAAESISGVLQGDDGCRLR
ncbi:hypothetical protein B0H14DRAFT_2910200 [Mycena olivaceomarginata]|nr:hypothetical protein B0H14DRAFT_2910200 [Mycena olivaceomarginata]